MVFNRSDLPYLFEDASDWETLSNGVRQQIAWEYSITEASFTMNLDDQEWPIIVEHVQRKQVYEFADYRVMAGAVDEWQYLDKPRMSYAWTMLGYRGYWSGEIWQGEERVLQPEVAVLLGLTNDFEITPAYIETVTLEELTRLLDEAHERFADDDALAFSRPVPIGTPPDAPDTVTDALRRLRAQIHLPATRGRAAVLDLVMNAAGIAAENGGWRILREEIERRQALGLR